MEPQGSEELRNRLPRHRIGHVRGDFGERFEHEAALAKTGVWHNQAGLVDRGVAKQQQVEIQAAGSVRVGALAAPLLFDGQQGVEHVARRHRCLPDRCGVQKERLRTWRAHRDGLEEVRHAKIAEKIPEPCNGVLKVGGAIAEVAAETDGCNDQIAR